MKSLDRLLKYAYCDLDSKFIQRCQVSGWLLTRPGFSVDEKGSESAQIVLYQIFIKDYGVVVRTVSVMTYSKKIIKLLKNKRNVCKVYFSGQFAWNSIKKTYFPRCDTLKIETETGFPLDPHQNWKEGDYELYKESE